MIFFNPLFLYTLIGYRILGTLVDKDYNNLKISKKRTALTLHAKMMFPDSQQYTF